MSEDKNPFGEGFVEAQPSPFIKWETVGQQVKGIFREVEERESSINQGEMQKIYTLEDENGDDFRVGSRGKVFDGAMKKVLFGQWCGFHYAEDIPSKKKGYSAFKNIKVYPGQMAEGEPGSVEDHVATEVPQADGEPPFEG